MSEDDEMRQEMHLLKQEMSALRELCEGAQASLNAAIKAYGAASQRCDMLDMRLERRKGSRA